MYGIRLASRHTHLHIFHVGHVRIQIAGVTFPTWPILDTQFGVMLAANVVVYVGGDCHRLRVIRTEVVQVSEM